LSRNQQRPFFIWLHFYDPHDPYDPPEPFKSHYAAAPYDGEIAYADSVIGSVMDVLQRHGLYQNAVIAIAADHGEAFGEHGEERHGVFLYDETIHVPLLIKLPAERFAGKRVETPVALADIAPTLLQAAGVSAPPTMQAQSLFKLIEAPVGASENAKRVENSIYSETNYAHRTFGWAELSSWRAEKYIYIQAPRRELYDQSSDPGALNNLAESSKAIAETLRAQLENFRRRTSSADNGAPKLDSDQSEKLRALGYLPSDSTAIYNDKRSAIDPKDKIAVASKFHRALQDIGEDDYDAAISELRDVVRLEPEMGSGYLELGRALVHRKQDQEALPILRTAAEKMPNSGMAHFEYGLLLIKTEQWDSALNELKAAVVCSPGSAIFHFNLAAILTHLKDLPNAINEYNKAIGIDPNYFEANLIYGRLLLQQGNPKMALPRLIRAATANPNSGIVHASLAVAYQRLGQTQNAERERAKAAQLKAQPPE
jgi:choline-sulfatase